MRGAGSEGPPRLERVRFGSADRTQLRGDPFDGPRRGHHAPVVGRDPARGGGGGAAKLPRDTDIISCGFPGSDRISIAILYRIAVTAGVLIVVFQGYSRLTAASSSHKMSHSDLRGE